MPSLPLPMATIVGIRQQKQPVRRKKIWRLAGECARKAGQTNSSLGHTIGVSPNDVNTIEDAEASFERVACSRGCSDRVHRDRRANRGGLPSPSSSTSASQPSPTNPNGPCDSFANPLIEAQAATQTNDQTLYGKSSNYAIWPCIRLAVRFGMVPCLWARSLISL